MKLPEPIPSRAAIQKVIGILGAGWTVDEIIEGAASDSYAGAVLIFADYIDEEPKQVEDCQCCALDAEPEPHRLQNWAWRRACRRAAINSDGPMTADTRRALLTAADVIQQHEPPPVLMVDVIQKAIEEAAGMAYNSTSWPGTRSIALRAIEMMCEEDARITHFLNQEVHGE